MSAPASHALTDVAAPRSPTKARRATRGWLAVCLGAAAVFIALGLLSGAVGGGPQGPVSSSYATNAQGLAAWAQLLRSAGHPVAQLRTPLAHARLDPSSTLVVLDPDALLHSEGVRLLAFVHAGGLLLFGGENPQDTLPSLLRSTPRWSANASRSDYRPAGAGAKMQGVDEVRSAGEGEWTSTKGYRRLLANTSHGALLMQRSIGRGTLELIADASPVQNRLLAVADNAQLALNLVGAPRRAVVFVESVHGFGEDRGLAALPASWWLALALLAFAGLVWISARARRLGPPEYDEAAQAPPRSAYVQAIARLLRRSGDTRELDAALTRLRDGQ